MAGKTRVGPLSSGLAKIAFGESKKRISALDKAIMEGKPLKSKNKNPERYLDK
jgi:hypothetical protein